MQFRRKPKKLPIVMSVDEVGCLLGVVPGPWFEYRAAVGISYGAGLRASEVCNLKVADIGSDQLPIHVDEATLHLDPHRKTFRKPDFQCRLEA